jgi:hypothetical protein
MSRTILCTFWLISAGLLLPALAISQTPDQQKEDASATRLELKEDKAVDKGKIAAVQGTLDAQGDRYTLGSLSILQPVMVRLIGKDADDLKLSLFKTGWTEAERSASTAGSGVASFEFRTEGGFNILITGAEATPYVLMVWAGDELHPPMPDVIVTPAQFKARNPKAADAASAGGSAASGGGVPTFVWVVVAALLGAGAVFFLQRRKQS